MRYQGRQGFDPCSRVRLHRGIIVASQANLRPASVSLNEKLGCDVETFQIRGALRSLRASSQGRYDWDQQRRQNADDDDDDKKFENCERFPARTFVASTQLLHYCESSACLNPTTVY